MKHFIFVLTFVCTNILCLSASEITGADTTAVVELHEVSVTGLYRNKINTGSLLDSKQIKQDNRGQEPSFMFQKLPNIFAYNDNGTQYGYSYFRLRGMGQERMNVTLDGMPWNEAEDFGCYFSNLPDMMASMNSVKVERGASVTTNGTAAYAGNISFETVDLDNDTLSYIDMGAGNFNTYRITGVYNMGNKNGWGLHIRGTMAQTNGYKDHSSNNSQGLTVKTGYHFNDNHYIDFLSITGFHRNGQSYLGVEKSQLPKHLNPFKQIVNGCLPQETDNFLMSINKFQYKGKFSNKTLLTASIYWNHLLGDYRVMIPMEDNNELWNYDLRQNLYGANVVGKFFLNDFTITTGINAYMFQRQHIGTILPADTIVNICHGYGPELFKNMGNKPDVNIFASGTYTNNSWMFKANLQYRYTSLNYNPNIAYIPTDTKFKHTWNFLNCGAEINKIIARNGTLYLRYALTHREPSRVDMFGGEYFTGDLFASTQAERVNDIELGYDIHTKNLQANLNLFYMRFNNELIATGELSANNGLPLHTQNNSYRTGVELSATWNIFKDFNFIVNGAWSANKIYVESSEGDTYTNNNTFSPDLLLYAECNYKFKYDWTLGVSMNYHNKMYVDISNEHYLPHAFALNTYLMKSFKRIDLSLNMNNITNKMNTSNGYVADNVMYYLVDAPFNFFINCKVKF